MNPNKYIEDVTGTPEKAYARTGLATLSSQAIGKERNAIDQETMELAQNLEGLHNVLGLLEDQLSIVSGSTPEDLGIADNPPRGNSPLYYRISEINRGTNAAIRRVAQIRYNLEV